MTDFKSILVHADSLPATAVRLQLAHRLAEQFDAAVTAAFAVTQSSMAYPGSFEAGAEVAAMMIKFDQERRARAKTLFDHAQASGLPRLAWRDLEGEPAHDFARAALYADLAVVGQPDPRNPNHDVPSDFIESVAFGSGAPLLVVPYTGAASTMGRTVLLAWKESREAARAVAAALPLLQAADRVHVVMWDSPDIQATEEAPRIEARLRLHAVPVTVHRCGRESRDTGEQLLSMAAEFNADMMVMGCYGHSRAREWVLGGATRTILRSMTLPVMMTH